MANYTPGEIRRITFLALIQAPALAGYDDPYQQARQWLDQMTTDGFFDEARPTQRTSSGPSRSSSRPASRGQSSNRGRDQGGGAWNGTYRDPDGPPSDKMVNAVLAMSDDYTEDDLYAMRKEDVGNLISDLKG
jgi:hypothetical protein